MHVANQENSGTNINLAEPKDVLLMAVQPFFLLLPPFLFFLDIHGKEDRRKDRKEKVKKDNK